MDFDKYGKYENVSGGEKSRPKLQRNQSTQKSSGSLDKSRKIGLREDVEIEKENAKKARSIAILKVNLTQTNKCICEIVFDRWHSIISSLTNGNILPSSPPRYAYPLWVVLPDQR